MEHFGRVSSKHLQRLIRACSQVVDSYVFILTSGRNHVSETEREEEEDEIRAQTLNSILTSGLSDLITSGRF